VKERPILFSGPLVRAILEGRKTVTRRLVKPLPQYIGGAGGEDDASNWGWETECGAFVVMGGDFKPYQGDDYSHVSTSYLANCPHGAPGDRLWVRETFALDEHFDEWSPRGTAGLGPNVWYRSDPGHSELSTDDRGKWRPSIHMPRWASRIDLEIVSVRAERLQNITDEDVTREGIVWDEGECPPYLGTIARARFAHLWDSINAKRPGASWADNPWVWRIEFRRVRP